LFAAFNTLEHRQKQLRNAYYKITSNLLFEYQCTSGKFIRLPNRIETFFARIGMLYSLRLRMIVDPSNSCLQQQQQQQLLLLQ